MTKRPHLSAIDLAQSPLGPRDWICRAVALLQREHRSATDTPLLSIPCPELHGIDLMLKDESVQPSGSLKHRLAHALFLHAICNGDIHEGTVVVEASSGSTAISEAWFACRLGLRFVAVVPEATACAKLEAITAMGGEIVKAPGGTDIRSHARLIARERGGHFMDQFGKAAEVADWRGSNNIAERLFAQVEQAGKPAPRWIVLGAGTGGTSATFGRYVRLNPSLVSTQLCVVDPEGSAFFRAYASGIATVIGEPSGHIEGIGRACVEPSFMPGVIDQMLCIPDIASIAGSHWLATRMGRKFGPSTGTNIIGCLLLAQAMRQRGETGTIVTLGCDGGERYADTIYSDKWLAAKGFDISLWARLLRKLAEFAVPD